MTSSNNPVVIPDADPLAVSEHIDDPIEAPNTLTNAEANIQPNTDNDLENEIENLNKEYNACKSSEIQPLTTKMTKSLLQKLNTLSSTAFLSPLTRPVYEEYDKNIETLSNMWEITFNLNWQSSDKLSSRRKRNLSRWCFSIHNRSHVLRERILDFDDALFRWEYALDLIIDHQFKWFRPPTLASPIS